MSIPQDVGDGEVQCELIVSTFSDCRELYGDDGWQK